MKYMAWMLMFFVALGARASVRGSPPPVSYRTISYFPGPLSTLANTKSGYSIVTKTGVVLNLIGSASALITCLPFPTITFYECGSDTSCTSPTVIGSVQITGTGGAMAGTIVNPQVVAGDLVAWSISAGVCISATVTASAEVMSVNQ